MPLEQVPPSDFRPSPLQVQQPQTPPFFPRGAPAPPLLGDPTPVISPASSPYSVTNSPAFHPEPRPSPGS